MRVKRYVVDTLPDALNKIRQELGKDAVILNTKQLKVGGFLGMFSKKKIEVIAAIDNESRVNKPQSKQVQQPASNVARERVESPVVNPVTPNALAAQMYRSQTGQADDVRGASPASVPRVSPATAEIQQQEPLKKDAAADEHNPIEQFKQAAARTIQEAASRPAVKAQAASPTETSREQQELLSEIKQMKELITNLSSGVMSNAQSDTASMNDPFRPLEERLSEQEVLPQLIASLKVQSQAAQEGDAERSELGKADARRLLRSQLTQLLGHSPISGIQADSRIVRFVGPTGVGKTTTIAKLAAEQVLKHNRKIGFITSDTYRIAAIDQLKTYGTILNVPVEVVFSPEEMEAALANLSDRDVIFMDTAGRNYRDENSIAELENLLADDRQSETYLVLSLAAKYSDIREIVSNFSSFHIDKVLWTKLDETTSYGAIANLQSEFSLPMSYITDGQNVPDDISLLDPDVIADLLLGEDADE